MEITLTLNGKKLTRMVEADTVLLDFLRKEGCYSVKRGCDTTNCGLCTVFMDNKPILSCSKLAVQADGHEIKTLEGLQEEALEFVGFIADQGADQCGFCNPGFVMNTIALLRENQDPTDDEIRAFLAGNLCRCSGYEGQLRGIRNFLDSAKLVQTRKIATDKVELKAHINEVSTPMRCIAPMDVVSKAELRSENTH